MSVTAYAAYYDHPVRELSSSGGIFSLLAEQFDIVYGVAMTEDCYGTTFLRIENGDVSPLRGSKYLQARLGDTFQNVKRDLLQEQTVLFTGTPCQINGLRAFLGKDFPTLTCVDVICHGVPSPALWKKYVTFLESRYGHKITRVDFRCKSKGDHRVGLKKNELFSLSDSDAYMRMFLQDLCLRPSCYACKAKTEKLSDMTIADFWGIEHVAPAMDDGKGTSLILVRTPKGAALFNTLKDRLAFAEVPYADSVKCNPSEYSSVTMPAQRETFYRDMNETGFKELCERYAPTRTPSLTARIKRSIRKMLGSLANKPVRLRYGLKFKFDTTSR